MNKNDQHVNKKTLREAEDVWKNFLIASKVCGGLTCLILALMALTLV